MKFFTSKALCSQILDCSLNSLEFSSSCVGSILKFAGWPILLEQVNFWDSFARDLNADQRATNEYVFTPNALISWIFSEKSISFSSSSPSMWKSAESIGYIAILYVFSPLYPFSFGLGKKRSAILAFCKAHMPCLQNPQPFCRSSCLLRIKWSLLQNFCNFDSLAS